MRPPRLRVEGSAGRAPTVQFLGLGICLRTEENHGENSARAPSQGKVGGGNMREAQVDGSSSGSHSCVDRIARLQDVYIYSNWGICYR